MKQLHTFCKCICLTLLLLTCKSNEMVFAQTPFVSPVIVTQTGASTSYSSVVATPESVNGSCTEVGQTWTHNFAGTANRKLNGFTIAATSYYVNNFGSLTTVMNRNNGSGGVPAVPTCPVTTPPWNDRQIVFFEGTRDATTNIASIVNSFPSTTLPGTAGYNAVNDMNLVFSRGFINSGADNIFNNLEGSQAGYNSNANNIERMDLFVSGGVIVTAANMNRVGIVMVCRGPADDPFVLSAIKGLVGGANIGGGTTYVYDDIIKVNLTWTSKTINGGGAIAIPAAAVTTLIPGINSVVLRRMDSEATLNDQLLTTDYPTISSFVATGVNNNIKAMFFTFADLGLAPGDVFYGYSVAGFDVTAVNSNQFNSYTNATYFPLTTNPADGGIDLTGFPGLFAAMDIDDDDDGLPDYLEANLANTFGDADSDGILNYCDATYPGFVDNNTDGINDNFDPSADSDNDGIQNYQDNTFVLWGWVDSNADGVNDIFDWDLDGVPNHLDRDCDNDGIPDVVESFGVDANGDGVIDNYTDTDVDGLSQNVDGNSTGAISSGVGLGAIDTDGDGVPNYMDLDSDNDGIPDVVEAYGTDANNDAIIDGYTDTDSDGYSDNVDGDVGNDNFAENSANSLLLTGSDGNSDGKADSYPNKNMDADSKPNPYDLDSDMDGITDVIEAGFTDANFNGIIDGAFNSKGWSTTVAAMGSLSLPNTDASGRVNVYDIDSDDDGIPDNVEGLPTNNYLLPANTDTDSDGLDNSYDNIVGYGGNGINPVDTDGDTIPDYLDSDTDGDGVDDIIEGNDFNLNGEADDNVTLTGIDTDNDGLDDRFDANNSTAEGTSAYMGNGGSFTGDASPGSITTVQKTPAITTDRDWRAIFYLLDCDYTSFKAVLQKDQVILDWIVFCRQRIKYFEIERSFDGRVFTSIQIMQALPDLQETINYTTSDNISGINNNIIYYRLKAVGETGRIKYSEMIAVRLNKTYIKQLLISPNPVIGPLQLSIQSEKQLPVEIIFANAYGKTLYQTRENLINGINNLTYTEVKNWQPGTYFIMVNTGEAILTKQFVLLK